MSSKPTPVVMTSIGGISATFPQLLHPLIDRPHIITALDTMFEGQVQAVVLEGEEGIGKTTIAAQFVESHPDRALCVFAIGPSALARSAEFLVADLCDQVSFLLTGKRAVSGEESATFLRRGFTELARRAATRGQVYYIVVDGFLEEPGSEGAIASATLAQLLPIGLRGFKFLMTGSADRLSAEIQKSVVIKPYTPAGFGLLEAREYLGAFVPEPKAFSEVYRLCRGIPGKLASVRRLLQQGADLRGLSDGLPATFNKLYELEWKALEACNVEEVRALAFLSHSSHNLTLEQVAILSGLQRPEVLTLVSKLAFLSLDEPSSTLTFVSASFKGFAALRLASYRNDCIDRIIEVLLGDGTSAEAVEHLPGYLQSVGRSGEVITYLTPDHLASVCERLRSLGPVRAAIQRGAVVAADLKLPVDTLRFALQQALVAELEVASVLGSELDARLEMEGASAALSLADTAFLKEDRLQLLAQIARHQKKAGEFTDPAVVEEIQQLASSADFTARPARAIEIAEDLICCLPDIAMALVEKAPTGESGRGLDLALARLSIVAADADSLDQKAGTARDSIMERIRSTGVRQLARAASLLAGEYKADELIKRCEGMNSIEDALFLLENWCIERRKDVDAWKATEYGLNLILKAASYTPTARVVRRLCTALPFCAPEQPYESNTILQQVDAQAGTLRARGPAVEFVRLQLCLAETEATWDLKQASSRLEELYFYIDTLQAPTRLESLSRCVEALARDETGRLRSITTSLLGLFEEELRKSVPSILSSTAEHADALGGVVAALAGVKPDFVSGVIRDANTTERRDKLRHRFAVCRFKTQRPLPLAGEIVTLLAEFESSDARDACLSEVIDWFFVHDDIAPTSEWSDVLKRSASIHSATLRHESVTKAYIVARRSSELKDAAFVSQLRDESRRSLESIESSWVQIDYGFTSTWVLSKMADEEARTIYRDTLSVRKVANLPNRPAAVAYLGCLKLAIRAFVGVVRRKLAVQDSLARLRELIAKVPSGGERARLYGELAIRCFSVGADDIGKVVAQNDLLPTFRAILDDEFKAFVLVETAPALFKLHRRIAFDELAKVSQEKRDEGLAEICSFIFSGLHGTDPNEAGRDTEFEIGYPEAMDILDCVDRLSKDSILFSAISRLVSSITRSGAPVTKEQRTEIARRIESAASCKLPCPTGVSHEGYRVAVDAQIARLRNSNEREWVSITSRVEGIPNICDRVLVFGLTAEALPSRYQELSRELLNKARNLASSIPSDLDRIDRLLSIGSIAIDIDSQIGKACLRDAFMLSKDSEGQEIEERQREMVDEAYRLDPAFAKSLVALLDNDPARSKAKDRLQKSVDLKDARREFGKESDLEVKIRKLSQMEVAELCWSLLGGLNSGRVATVNANATIPYLQISGPQRLSDVYPVLAWMIENSVQRHDDTPFGATHLSELFNTAAFACDFAMRLISRASGLQQELSALSRPLTDSKEAIIIYPGQREKATTFLREWLAASSPEYLKICDPYFTVNDLAFLMLVREVMPSCRIQLLTSERKQKEAGIAEPFEDSYKKYWRLHISDQDPPDTDIIIVSVAGTGDSPIHDRWIVSGGTGLRLGSSFSGMGAGKTTEISVLQPPIAADREREIDQYLTRQLRDVLGKRIRYQVFSLF